MKNKLTMMAATVAAIMSVTASVQATLITGSINFDSGSVTLNSPTVAGATAITAFGGTTVVSSGFGVAPVGSYAGTAGQTVTYLASGFTFLPTLSPNPVVPLWTFTLLGITYSFDLTSVISGIGVAGQLNLGGNGILHITGLQDTAGTWNLSTAGVGPSTFGFVAGNAAIPDGGMTVMLLGAALTGLFLVRKQVLA